jgi:hypothetical protein
VADNIDFAKVDAAFQHLADSPEGGTALDQLAKALDHVASNAKPQLNRAEAHFLLTNLVQQRSAPFGPGLVGAGVAKAGNAKTRSGFFIKTAVPE